MGTTENHRKLKNLEKQIQIFQNQFFEAEKEYSKFPTQFQSDTYGEHN